MREQVECMHASSLKLNTIDRWGSSRFLISSNFQPCALHLNQNVALRLAEHAADRNRLFPRAAQGRRSSSRPPWLNRNASVRKSGKHCAMVPV